MVSLPPMKSSWWRSIAAGALLVGLTVCAYLPVRSAGFIWDDDEYVTGNRMLTEPGGLRRIWFEIGATPQYYPLTFTTLWAQHHIWGNDAPPYHAANVMLHAAAALMLWRILRRLDVPGAWLAAAVFAVHPVNVESVAWITERKNVLAAMLGLAALWVYLPVAGLGEKRHGGPRIGWLWLAAFVLFVAALLSKTVICVLPVVILLLIWWKRGYVGISDVVALVPFFVVGLAAGLLTAYLERGHVGAEGAEWALTPIQRVLLAGRVPWFYAAKLVWPASLTFVYPRWHIDAGQAWQYVFPLGTLVTIVLLVLFRRRIGSAPAAAAIIFLVALFPALGFFNVYPMRFSFVADHFQYLAGIALTTLFIAAIWTVLARAAVFRSVLAAALLLVFVVLTRSQASIYDNVEHLWRDTISKNESAWLAHHNLGAQLIARGRREEAIAEFKRTLELYPDFPDAHNNLGVALAGQGLTEEAISHFEFAIRRKPKYIDPYVNLGVALTSQGKYRDAVGLYRKALKIRANHPEALNNMGIALLRMGRRREALIRFTQAVNAQPDYANAHFNRAGLLAHLGQAPEAIYEYERTLQLEPTNARARQELEKLESGQTLPTGFSSTQRAAPH